MDDKDAVDFKLNKTINNNNLSNQLILAVDIGTTNLKCSLYDENLEIIHASCAKVNYILFQTLHDLIIHLHSSFK